MRRILFVVLMSVISFSLSAQTHVEIKRARVFQDVKTAAATGLDWDL